MRNCNQKNAENNVSEMKISNPTILTLVFEQKNSDSLLAVIALFAVQSSAQTFIHNAIMFMDPPDNA